MAHFAKLGVNGKVIAVHGLDNDQMLNADNQEDETVGQQRLQQIHGWPAQMWIQTSYNTLGGEHLNGGTPLRKNFASVGYTYDAEKDAFIPPQTFPSWVLNETSCLWEPPTPIPDNENVYRWDEETKSWQRDD